MNVFDGLCTKTSSPRIPLSSWCQVRHDGLELGEESMAAALNLALPDA